MKYTHLIAFCCISFRSVSFLFLSKDAFLWDKRILLTAFLFDFFSQNYLGSISLITRYICMGGSVPIACAFYPEAQTVETHSGQRIYPCAV